jgi:hypothetical protein
MREYTIIIGMITSQLNNYSLGLSWKAVEFESPDMRRAQVAATRSTGPLPMAGSQMTNPFGALG